MTKRRAKRLFIITAVIAVLLGVLTFVSFPIPFTVKGVGYNYNSFIKNVSLGLDLNGGMSAIYTAALPEGESESKYDEFFDSTIEGLKEIMNDLGYTQAVVAKQGEDSIRVELPDIDEPQRILTLLGEPALLKMKTTDSAEAEAFLTGKNIKNVEAQYDYQNVKWGVAITFDDEGSDIFATKTGEIAQSGSPYLYIYLGDTKFSSGEVSDAITGGQTFISGGSINDQETAEQFAIKIKSGTLSLDLSKLSSGEITAAFGINTLQLIIGGFALAMVLIILWLWYAYGDFGLLASFSMLFWVMLTIFFMQAIPGILFTVTGVIGFALGLAVFTLSHIILFEKIKSEYQKGKTFMGSIKQGYKKSFMGIVDVTAVSILAGILFAIFGNTAIQSFAFVLLIGLAMSAFCTLLVSKRFLDMYLPYNYENAKKVRFSDIGRVVTGEVADEK